MQPSTMKIIKMKLRPWATAPITLMLLGGSLIAPTWLPVQAAPLPTLEENQDKCPPPINVPGQPPKCPQASRPQSTTSSRSQASPSKPTSTSRTQSPPRNHPSRPKR